jgi:CheY-like chemotaxis protein
MPSFEQHAPYFRAPPVSKNLMRRDAATDAKKAARTTTQPRFRSRHPGQGTRMDATGCTRTKVLVVDDEAGYCRKLGRYLSARGFEVVTATSGEEAVSIGTRTRPELLITDWMLRGEVHGLHVVDALKTIYPKTRTVMMSGFASTDLREEAAQRDVAEFVEKPFSPEQLESAVERALRMDTPSRPNLRIPLVSTDTDGRILRSNDAFIELLGRELGDGAVFHDLFPSGAAPDLAAAAAQWLEVAITAVGETVPCRLRTRSFGEEGWMALLCRNEDAAELAYDPSVKLLIDDSGRDRIRWKLNGHGLVVDPDGSTRSLVSSVFEELGSICHTAHNLERALEIYEKDAEVRYVVIDCAAGEDIQAFVARAMRIRPGCTIVGQCEQRFDIEFARAGIRDTIRKPWTVSDFMSLLIDHE